MRKLNLKDAFKMVRIIKSAEIRDALAKLAPKFKDPKNVSIDEIGFEVILTIISAAGNPKVEQQIYELIADIRKIDAEKVSEMDFSELKAFIKELVEENDLRSFFDSASKLM